MKVLLLNQFFYPDISATSQMATDLGVDLARAGLEVSALAGQRTYTGGGRLPAVEVYQGVRIVRVPSTSFGRNSIARRAADYASFYASAIGHLARKQRPDIVVAMSTPPLVSVIAAGMQMVGARFVYWVQDLYPDLAL